MKKTFLLIINFCVSLVVGYGQYTFVSPTEQTILNCHINVNQRTDQNFRNDLKRAIFKLTIPGTGGGDCSATLINRNTGQTALGQYFITAWHCFRTGANCAGNDFNFNNPVTLTFNFQSPNSNTLVFSQNSGGQAYQIQRQVRLVDHLSCAEGDFALCEILGPPIPAYFNVYYAGWKPNDAFIQTNSPFAAIHHPAGSIKKITGTGLIIGNDGPKSTCKTVTKVVDFLFGWLWKRKWSTEVICTYTQVPFVGTKYLARFYDFGKVEPGSSGGGLFNKDNRFMGQLSATVPDHTCASFDPGVSQYGKISDSYYRQKIKNTLNPPNKYWIDQNGIPGRQITCHPQISISGTTTQPANLYPANLYQADNKVVLTSRTNFISTGQVTVRTLSDFVFEAGTDIVLNPGFSVEAGATFSARISPAACTINEGTYRLASDEEPSEYETPDMNEVLSVLPPLQEKKFNINKYLNPENEKTSAESSGFKIYPNPANNRLNLQAFFKEKENNVSILFYDLTGRKLWSKHYKDIYYLKEEINVAGFANGIYNVVIVTAKLKQSKKVILVK